MVPCETCGRPTPMTGTKRCDACWEVEHRLRAYLINGGFRATVTATKQGVAELGEFERLPTGKDLLEYWLYHLPEGESTLLSVIARSYPGGVSRDTLTDTTGYKRSTRDAYLYRLSTRRLIRMQRGLVQASEVLFS